MVTGEPLPVEKGKGSRVTGSTVNGTGGFVMRAERVGKDSLLAQIVQLVAEAQRSRAPVQRLADSVAGWFVPAVVASRRPPSRSGRSSGPSPASPTRSWPRSRCSSSPVRAPSVSRRPCRSWWASARGVGRRPREERRGPRDPRQGGHAGGRQDRHPHRGPPGGAEGRRPGQATPRSSGSPRASSAGASTRWPPPSWARPRARPRPRAGRGLRIPARTAEWKARSRAVRRPREPGLLRERGIDSRLAAAAEAERREGRTVVFLAVDGQPRASSPWPTR